MTPAERIALEQIRYWRSIGLTYDEMLAAIGNPHTLTPGEEEADVIEALAWAWAFLTRKRKAA